MRNGFRYIYFFVLMAGAGQSVIFAIFPPLARELALTEFQAGTVMSAGAFIAFLASPFWGKRLDRVGSRLILALGVTGYCVFNLSFAAVLGLGLSDILPSMGVLLMGLIITRGLFAFSTAAIMPSAQTYMLSETSPANRPAKMAMLGMMFGLGMILGPGAGSVLVHWGMIAPILTIAFVIILPLPLALRYIEKQPEAALSSRPQAKTLRYTDPRIWPFFLLLCGVYLTFAAIQQTAAFFIQDLLQLDAKETARLAGGSFMLAAFSSVIAQGVIIQRWKPSSRTLISMGIPALVGTLLILSVADNLVMILSAFVLLGIAFGFIYPGVTSRVSQLFEQALQGQVAGALQAAMSLGFIIGPLLGSGLYGLIGHWVYTALLLLLLPFTFYAWRTGKAAQVAPAPMT